MAAAKKPAKRMSAKQMKKTKGGSAASDLEMMKAGMNDRAMAQAPVMPQSPSMSKIPKLPTLPTR